jgi:hypothetical protein
LSRKDLIILEYLFGYLFGMALGDLFFTIPVYLITAKVMKNIAKHKRLKIFGLSLAMVLALSAATGDTTGGFNLDNAIIMTIEVAFLSWISSKRKLVKDKGDQGGIGIG